MAIAEAANPASPEAGNELIRVMIVDDSAVVRGLISRWISEDPVLEVASRCLNGQLAIENIEEIRPDVLVLDIEMPVMDGLTALPELLKRAPECKIIMASTMTRRNAEISLRALSMGATDYITKPAGHHGETASPNFKAELLSLIKAVGKKQNPNGSISQTAELNSGATINETEYKFRPFSLVRPRILAIGSSTGGPQALSVLLKNLSPVLAHIPTVITQHMPPTFTTILAEQLSRATQRSVKEGETGEIVESGKIYIAPGDMHMVLERGDSIVRINLNSGNKVNYCKPAVDPMVESVVRIYGASVLYVILTGMGQDGTYGAKLVSEAGGSVIAQDEKSSVVWGMPGTAVATGCCSAMLPLDRIGSKIASLLRAR